MTQTLTNLFNNGVETNGGVNQLGKTGELTNLATTIANDLLKKFDADAETFAPKIQESIVSHDAMDKLIAENYNLVEVNVSFLAEESDDTLDKMIRSQQSKRSRSKSKVMTMDNYKTMLIGAIAENLLRIAGGKPKSASGGGVRSSEISYTEEELQALAADQEALKREIRNIQSKKSIMKSKADFDEGSDRWQQLLEAEEILKELRVGGSNSSKAVEATNKINDLLGDIELDSLKAADAKDLLAKIKEVLQA